LDPKRVEEAVAWLRRQVDKANGELPEWGAYKDLVKAHLNDPYNTPFKLPSHYHYAYLRVKGLSHNDAAERMGLDVQGECQQVLGGKQRWWKFW
jgi:hypothetical protein